VTLIGHYAFASSGVLAGLFGLPVRLWWLIQKQKGIFHVHFGFMALTDHCSTISSALNDAVGLMMSRESKLSEAGGNLSKLPLVYCIILSAAYCKSKVTYTREEPKLDT
jgi:hypothetical protein